MFSWPHGFRRGNIPQGASLGGGLFSLVKPSIARAAAQLRADHSVFVPNSCSDAHPSRVRWTVAARIVALSVSLVVSALLTTAALRLPDQQWLTWISFLPLFVVVRSLRPSAAALAGGLWGGCLYLFCTIDPTPAINSVARVGNPSALLLALLVLIPSIYLGLAARPARAIGYKLLTLALGWTLIEVILHLFNPSGASGDLLTGSQGDGVHLHWLVRLLGYVCTAFVVVCANTSLLIILRHAKLTVLLRCLPSAQPSMMVGAWAPATVPVESTCLLDAHPRAPPTDRW